MMFLTQIAKREYPACPIPPPFPGVEYLAPITESYAKILTPEAVAFVVDFSVLLTSAGRAAGCAPRTAETARCR